MNIIKEYNAQQNTLLLVAKGRFSLSSYQETLIHICNNSEFSADVPTVWDLRGFDFTTFTSQSAYQVRDFRKDFRDRLSARVAMVVSNKLGYGMIRLVQSISNADENTHVCYDLDQAIRWLLEKAQQT